MTSTAITAAQTANARAPAGSRVLFPIHSNLSTMAALLLLALLPFQTLGIPVGTTIVDLSNVILLAFALVVAAGNDDTRYSRTFMLLASGFAVLQLLLWLNSLTPFSRFMSGIVWFMAFILIYGRGATIYVPMRASYRIVIGVVALLAVYIVFQLLVLGMSRPAGFMAEPSPAGLVMLAVAAGLVVASRKSSSSTEQLVMTIAAVILAVISYALKTTHIISFIVALFITSFFSKALSVRLLLILVAVTIGFFSVAMQDVHFRERLDIGGTTSNLSLLSWLQGYDQMIESLRQFPLVGAGLGGTGYFDVQSANARALFEAGISELNRYDAYSGFFRIVIEVGPVVAIAIFYAIGYRLVKLWRATSQGLLPTSNESKYQLFLFVFAFTLFVGIFLKEPTYSRSQVAVAVVLYFLVPLNAYRSRAGVSALTRAHSQSAPQISAA